MARDVDCEMRETSAGQLHLFAGPFRGLLQQAEVMRGISVLSDATFAELEKSESLFQQFDAAAKPYKKLLDVYVAQYFGVEQADEFLRLYGAEVMEADTDSVGEPYATVVREARQLYEGKRFFHWDLEFPEVFIDLEKADWKENPGFDVVVGNPPYVRQEQISENKPFFQAYYTAYHGMADIYIYFIEQGLGILREDGQFGFIVSDKFMRANYGSSLRQLLTTRSCLRQIVDFGELPVFEEAAAFPAIVLFQKGMPEDGQEVKVVRMKTLEFGDLESEVRRLAHMVTDHGLADEGWSLARRRLTDILRKMEQTGIPLGQYVGKQIYYGIKTGFNQAFFIDQTTRDRLVAANPASSELIKPLIIGDDVRRYEINYQDRFIIFARRGVDIERYPAIKSHLEQFRERLEPRPSDHTGHWQGRKSGNYKWYEIQDTVEYWSFFKQPKIVYPIIAREPRFVFDEGHYYTNDKCFIIPQRDFYLLALLNSHLLFEATKLRVSVLGDEYAGGRLELRAVHLQHLPIRHIAFTTPPDERARLVEVGTTEATEFIEHTERAASVSFSAFSVSVFHRWLDERLSPTHTPDPALVRQHNADPLNEDWQLPEDGPVEQSDVVHDLLAHLAEQMMALNKEKQAEIKGFLSWLETSLGCPVDDLSGKTYVRAYHERNFDELLSTLKKNRRRIQPDLDRRGPLEALRAEWGASMGKLRPLLARLAATDRLIDLIVYRLYGLTGEEVAVVEGKHE
jgi:hypothetical protein